MCEWTREKRENENVNWPSDILVAWRERDGERGDLGAEGSRDKNEHLNAKNNIHSANTDGRTDERTVERTDGRTEGRTDGRLPVTKPSNETTQQLNTTTLAFDTLTLSIFFCVKKSQRRKHAWIMYAEVVQINEHFCGKFWRISFSAKIISYVADEKVEFM